MARVGSEGFVVCGGVTDDNNNNEDKNSKVGIFKMYLTVYLYLRIYYINTH